MKGFLPRSWWSYLQRCSSFKWYNWSAGIWPNIMFARACTNTSQYKYTYLIPTLSVVCMDIYLHVYILIYWNIQGHYMTQCASWRKCVLWNIYASAHWVILGPGNSLLPFWSLSAPMPNFVDLVTKNKLQRNLNQTPSSQFMPKCIWKYPLPNGKYFVSRPQCIIGNRYLKPLLFPLSFLMSETRSYGFGPI